MTVAVGTYYLVPLRPVPQSFQMTLLGVPYGFKTRWSNALNCWMLSLYDSNGNLIVGEVPMVTGADLFEEYGYLGIGGGFMVQDTAGPPNAVPTFTSLGITGQLLFFPYAVAA